MTKHRWKESMKSFATHLDPEKEDQQKWMNLEIETQVKRSLKLIKSINQGNKEVNLKKKAELTQLVEDFLNQYQSLYSLYDDLREEVRKSVHGNAESSPSSSSSSSSSSSEIESYYSPDTGSRHGESKGKRLVFDQKFGGDVLKDKLIPTSEVIGTFNLEKEEDLQKQIACLKLELESLSTQKRELQEQVEFKASKAKQLMEENSGLKSRVSELEQKDEYCKSVKKLEDDEKHSMSKIEDLTRVAKNLEQQVDALHVQKGKLEQQLLCKTKELGEVKGLSDHVNVLQKEVMSLRNQKMVLELELKEKSQQVSECMIHMENLEQELESKNMHQQGTLEEKGILQVKVNDLETEVSSLCSQRSDLEEQMVTENKANDKLHFRILDLEKAVREKEDELASQENYMFIHIENLQKKLDELQMEKIKLEPLAEREEQDCKHSPIEQEEQRKFKALEDAAEKLNHEHKQLKGKPRHPKLTLQNAEKKMDEMAAEFRKQCEDKIRILSRRIRVAEQLQLENKEWYRTTKDGYHKEHQDINAKTAEHEISLKKVKDLSLTAKDMLAVLDNVALKFVECEDNFLNRISKVSCEITFTKDWMKRKNKAIKHVTEDLECQFLQLDDKEAEILGFREKLWRLESKVRELEKMVKDKDEETLVLREEKREAIRQLCVWIDYHKSRSDYYKKMLPQQNVRYVGKLT